MTDTEIIPRYVPKDPTILYENQNATAAWVNNWGSHGVMLAEEGSIKWLRENTHLEDWAAQVKFDGLRCWAYIDPLKKSDHQVVLRTRRGHDMAKSFPDVTELLAPLLADFVVDGEIIAYGPGAGHKLAHVQKRNNVTNNHKLAVLRQQFPAEFVAFDLVRHPSFMSHATVTFTERMHLLNIMGRAIRDADHHMTIADTYYDLPAELESLWRFVQSESLEGLVAKRKDSRYRLVRSPDWRKIKY